MRGEGGQALVEAAVILPAFVFLLLLAIQLTQLQQARLFAEYAAFAAARAGIVFNGDAGKDGTEGRMRDAAALAILPSFGRTDSLERMTSTLARFEARQRALRPLGLSQIRIHVHNPVAADFDALGQHLNRRELDFDDVRPAASEATLLSLQISYLYELRVPFANRMLQTLWLAARTAMLRGRSAVADGTPEGIPLSALVAAAESGRYFLPLQAFWTMRMQSNPFRRWARP